MNSIGVTDLADMKDIRMFLSSGVAGGLALSSYRAGDWK